MSPYVPVFHPRCIQALAARASKDLLPSDEQLGGRGSRGSIRTKGDGNTTQRKMTAHRPKYRDSKLTLLLKNSLEGNAILVMIAVSVIHLLYASFFHPVVVLCKDNQDKNSALNT